jgi:hypothetical protein
VIAGHVRVSDLIAAVRPGRTAGQVHRIIVRLVESEAKGRNAIAPSGENAPIFEQWHGYDYTKMV